MQNCRLWDSVVYDVTRASAESIAVPSLEAQLWVPPASHPLLTLSCSQVTRFLCGRRGSVIYPVSQGLNGVMEMKGEHLCCLSHLGWEMLWCSAGSCLLAQHVLFITQASCTGGTCLLSPGPFPLHSMSYTVCTCEALNEQRCSSVSCIHSVS